MEIKQAVSCPLGSQCEEIRDNTAYRCAWFVQMAGKDPSTGQDLDKKGCAMAWMPILLVENSRQQVRTTAAVESFRNETVEGNEETRKLMVVAAAMGRMPQQQPAQLGGDPAQTLIGG